MGLKDFVIYGRDKFEPDVVGLDFPCFACQHRHGSCTDEPCRTCDHNVMAVHDDKQEALDAE